MAYKKRRSYKKRPMRKRKSFARKGSIKKVVRRELSRVAEVKTLSHNVLNAVLSSSADSVNANIQNTFELGFDGVNIACSQGTGQGNRIGNRVILKNGTFKGCLVPLPYHATTNPVPRPVIVKMVMYYDRSDPLGVPQPFSTGTAAFFQNGNTNQPFLNDLADTWSDINKDRYRVFATKVFKLGAAAYTGSGNSPDNQGFINNDFKYNGNFKIDFTKMIPKVVQFNDNSAIPTSRSIYCTFFYCLADGQNAGGAWRMVGLQWTSQVKFTDM